MPKADHSSPEHYTKNPSGDFFRTGAIKEGVYFLFAPSRGGQAVVLTFL
jgi:hypothetical protein